MKWIKALGATAALGVLLVGVPWLLVHFVGNPWPTEGLSLSGPISDGVILGVLAVVVWLLWAQLTVCVVIEIVAAIVDRDIQVRLPAFGFQQQLAHVMVSTVVIALVAAPLATTAATAASASPPAHPGVTDSHTALSTGTDAQTGPGAGSTTAAVPTTTGQTNATPRPALTHGQAPEDRATAQTASSDAPASASDAPASAADVATPHEVKATVEQPAAGVYMTVERGDSLWSIAARHLGGGERWSEIAGLNEGQVMNDGITFKAAGLIRPGWVLTLPGSAGGRPSLASPTPGAPYVVRTGDTLSQIAEDALGDAEGYPAIAEASASITQPDGAHLVDPDLIRPGWTIHVPSLRAVAGEPSDSPTEVGDKPSDEPSGSSSTAPDLTGATGSGRGLRAVPSLRPGEHPQQEPRGTTPTTTEPDASSKPPAVPAPTSPPAARSTDPSATASSAPSADPSAATGAAGQAADEDDGAWPIRTVGGVGALLAAALISLVAVRRRRQQRRRDPGQTIPMPQGQARQVEEDLRAVVDEDAGAVIDHVLKALAYERVTTGQALPRVRAARLSVNQLDLYLDQAAELPAPWQPTVDATVWLLPLHLADGLSAPDDFPAPYPGLCTVGHDAEDGHVLLNLEHVGDLGVTGLPALVWQAITAIGLELATCPWATELQVTFVGGSADLVTALNNHKVRHVPFSGMVRPEAGRAEIVLALSEISESQRAAFAPFIGNGLVLVAANHRSGPWTLAITDRDHAVVTPLGVPVRPQILDADTQAGLLEVLTTALTEPMGQTTPHDPLPAPTTGADSGGAYRVVTTPVGGGWTVLDAAAGGDVDETVEGSPKRQPAGVENSPMPAAAPAPTPEQEQEPEPRGEVPHVAADPTPDGGDEGPFGDAPSSSDPPDPVVVPTAPTPPPAPTVPVVAVGQLVDELAAAVPRDTAVPAAGQSHDVRQVPAFGSPLVWRGEGLNPLLRTGHPVIRLLGSNVSIVGASTEKPSSRTHQEVLTQLATFIALYPGSSKQAITEGVWRGRRVSPGTVDSRISNLRAWLGTNPETGAFYLPQRARSFDSAVRTDWQIFLDLIGPAPHTASTEALERALSLIQGRPRIGDTSRHYGFAEFITQDMISGIVDVAYEVARRRYMEGRWRRVEEAAAVGVTCEPGTERIWRIWIHAAHSAGNAQDVAEALDRMQSRIAELGFELEPETRDLITALEERDLVGLQEARKAL